MECKIITIGREYGSGGRLVGERLARELGFSFYDKELIGLTAKQSGFAESVVSQTEGKKTGSLLYGLYMAGQELPVSDQIYIAQTKVIRQIAEKGACVIVGRCADYVLEENEGCLRVFVHAAMDQRLRRVREEYGEAPEKSLASLIRKEDKRRSSYYNYFTQKKWGDMKNYDLCINTSLGIDNTVDLLARLVRRFG